MKTVKYSIVLFLLLFFYSCSTMELTPADFSWPIESVLKVDNNGNIQDQRYSVTLNAKGLFFTETGDSLAYLDKKLHLIRNSSGYYFIVGNNFKNVYVFSGIDGAMRLKNKIVISDSTGIQNPAFNQRPPYIELSYGDKKINLSVDGIERENGK